MSDFYLWIKTGHVVALIAWMAAMFYLPRLYVYHAGAPVGSELSETLKVMERRLLKAIMTPAMLATWAFGLWAAFDYGWFTDGTKWLHVKLIFVLAMTGFHGACAKWRKDFAADRNQRPARFYRIANEVPTLLLLVIAVLAVVKPF